MISIITDNRIPERPRKSVAELEDVVRAVLDDVKKRGDEALKEYEEKFDKVRLSRLAVTPEEMDEADLAGASPLLFLGREPRLCVPAQEKFSIHRSGGRLHPYDEQF